MTATAAAVPFVAARIGIAGGYYLVFMGLFLPWMAWRSRAKLTGQAALPPLARHLTSIIVIQLVTLVTGLAIARVCVIRIYPAVVPRLRDALLGALALAAMLAFMVPQWKGAVRKGHRRLYFFMPHGTPEKALWTGVSLAAGFCEESVYRGVMFALLVTLTGNIWLAAVIGAAVFAAAHAFQSARSMAIIFFIALLFQALMIATGALYVGMVVHAAYDIVAGFTYSRFGRELGYRADGDPGAAATGASPPAGSPPAA